MSDQFDYPVSIVNNHRAVDTNDYTRDRFDCLDTGAYIHTGGWPAFDYCPFCGDGLRGGQ